MILTNSALDALPKGKEIKDDMVPGLSARRHASGVSFMYYYRTRTGIPRRPKIGAYPVVTIKMAREIAKGMAAQVAAGRDPAHERSVARDEPDMNALWKRCEEEHYSRGDATMLKPGEKVVAWHREAKRLYQRNVAPRIGKVRLRSVEYDHIHQIHQALRKSPIEANRTLAVLSKMLYLAERWKWRDSGTNPCQHVERYQEKKRKRYATPEEIARVGAILERYAKEPEHVDGVAFLYLMMFSGARPSEIQNGTPAQLQRIERDGQLFGVLRLDDGKTGQRDVFLPPQAMAVLDKLPQNRERLANRRTMPRALWEAVRKEAGCADMWARDWRRTFATVGLSNGMPIGQIGELLGHATTQTTKIYAKLMEDPALQAAAAIAGKMQQLLTGAPENVEVQQHAPDADHRGRPHQADHL